MSSAPAIRVRLIGDQDGGQLIDVAVYGPAANGRGSAPLIGRGIALPAEAWRAILPEIAELIGDGAAA